MMEMLNIKCKIETILFLACAIFFGSLFFDTVRVSNFVSIPRLASFLIFFSFLFVGKENIITAIQSVIIIISLLIYLILRSALGNPDFSDPYFYAVVVNLLMTVAFIGVMLKINNSQNLLIAIFLISGLFAISILFGLGDELYLQDFRVSMWSIGLNEYALLLIIGLTTCLVYSYYFYEKKHRVCLLCIVCMSILTYAIFATGTRIVIVGALIEIIFYAIVVFIRTGKLTLFILHILPCFLVLLVEFSKVYISQAYMGFNTISGKEFDNFNHWGRSSFLERFDIVSTGINHNINSVGGRLDGWIISLKAFISSPIFGLGYEGFKEYSKSVYGQPILPINIFLEILAYGGVVTFIFILPLGRCLWGRLTSKNFEIVLILIFPLLIIGISVNVATAKLFWFYFAFCVYFLRLMPLLKH